MIEPPTQLPATIAAAKLITSPWTVDIEGKPIPTHKCKNFLKLGGLSAPLPGNVTARTLDVRTQSVIPPPPPFPSPLPLPRSGRAEESGRKTLEAQ